jgi:hypothetical protein
MEMQCPICYDAITQETGQVTLGCSHNYHFKCIAQWMYSSVTCPCCRSKFNNYEHIPLLDYAYNDSDLDDVSQLDMIDFDIYYAASTLLSLQSLRFTSTLNPDAESFTPS